MSLLPAHLHLGSMCQILCYDKIPWPKAAYGGKSLFRVYGSRGITVYCGGGGMAATSRALKQEVGGHIFNHKHIAERVN